MIEILESLKAVDSNIRIRYTGRIPSFNDIYESKHWKIRYSLSEKWHNVFLKLFKKHKIPKIGVFSLLVLYNTRHDVDNLVGVEKFFTDALTIGKYIVNDNQKCFKSLHIIVDKELPKNTVDFIIIPHEE